MSGVTPFSAPSSSSVGALVAAGLPPLDLSLTPPQLGQLDRYAAELALGAGAFNLTALSDPRDVAEKHFLDSLTLLPAIPASAKTLIDVGTGAGFPGLVLKIARPDLDVILLEATAKKVTWLQHVIRTLDLRGATAIAERAETLAHDPRHRGAYDVAVARAVAPFAVLCELCLPLVRTGGRFIAPKSAAGVAVEVPAAARALDLLGGRLVEVRPVAHPALPNRTLVIVEHERPAPELYPRRPGMPAKRPL